MVGNIHSRFAYCTSSACKIQNEENSQFQILEGAGLLCRTLFYLFGRNAYWGKEPVGGDKWSRLCDLSVYDKYEFRWYGPYLCLGDAKSVIIHTMTEQGVKYVSRIILPDGLMYPPGFGIDGKGALYITMGSYYKSGIIRYDDNGKYTTLPFSMFGYETFREGCIPVPDTARMISLHEYNARNNSGIWLEPGLLDLDMATRRCRIAPLHHIGDGLFRLHLFQRTGFW